MHSMREQTNNATKKSQFNPPVLELPNSYLSQRGKPNQSDVRKKSPWSATQKVHGSAIYDKGIGKDSHFEVKSQESDKLKGPDHRIRIEKYDTNNRILSMDAENSMNDSYYSQLSRGSFTKVSSGRQKYNPISATMIQNKMTSSQQQYTFGKKEQQNPIFTKRASNNERKGHEPVNTSHNEQVIDELTGLKFVPKHIKSKRFSIQQEQTLSNSQKVFGQKQTGKNAYKEYKPDVHKDDNHHQYGDTKKDKEKREKGYPTKQDLKQVQSNPFKQTYSKQSSRDQDNQKDCKQKYSPRPPTRYDYKNYDRIETPKKTNQNNDGNDQKGKQQNSTMASLGKKESFRKKKHTGNHLDNFQMIKRLGKGSYGNVYMVRQIETGAIFALKIMNKEKIREDQSQLNIFRESKIHLYLSHPHIIQLYGIFSDNDNIYLVMEYLNEGSLHDMLQAKVKFNEKITAQIAKHLAEAIQYMHEQKIIHRDLKLQNIMSSNGVLKIGDFGCAVHTFNLRDTKIGSLAYHSPQQLMEGNYDQKVDIWSLGIIVYELLYGQTPFDDDIIKIIGHEPEAKLSELKFPSTVEVSKEAKNFIMRLLQKNPNRRMGIHSVKDHPFITLNVKEDTQKLFF